MNDFSYSLTRKEAARIIRKYQINGIVLPQTKLPQEYFMAKLIWQSHVEEESKSFSDVNIGLSAWRG